MEPSSESAEAQSQTEAACEHLQGGLCSAFGGLVSFGSCDYGANPNNGGEHEAKPTCHGGWSRPARAARPLL